MDKKEILAFINKNPTSYMATVEGTIPHVRPIGTYRADENGLVYFMQTPKEVCQQLMKNPELEACYFAEGTTVRIHGTVEKLNDMTIKESIVERSPFLKPGIEKDGWDFLTVWIISHAKACVADMKGPPPPPGAPKVWVDL
jgi:pyridoxamine 5'-phosphate oxidase